MKKQPSKKTDKETENKKTDTISINGTHNEIAKFKGFCKMKGKNIGEELITLLTEYNKKQKID